MTMTPAPVRLALRGSVRDVKYVHAVRSSRAAGVVGEVYTQLERDFGLLAPPVALHSPSPAVLAAVWAMLRESLIADGLASRADKEVVAAAVSMANSCPYCVEVHGMALGSLGHGGTADAIGGGASERIEDPGTRALAAWAAGGTGGIARPERIPELVAVAVAFHYLNRVVNVFLGSSPLPGAVPASARPMVRSVLGRFLRPGAATPGDSLGLLPEATGATPGDLKWTDGSEIITAAFVRAGEAVERAAGSVVSPRIREVVLRELASWNGTSPGLSRSWVESPVSVLPDAERPAARLALLTAIAAYQVDETVVADFRRGQPEDNALVELVAWASLIAARGFGKRLAGTARQEKTAMSGSGDDRVTGSKSGHSETGTP
jgi:AhpD family alkylhydroperoxidase